MSFLNGLKNLKSRLTTLGNREPLSFLSIALIIGLDVFVLFNLFQGLDFQSRQITYPNDVIPSQCLSFVTKQQGTNEDITKEKTNMLLSIGNSNTEDDFFNHNYNVNYFENNNTYIDSKCQEIYSQALVISKNPEIIQYVKQINTIGEQINQTKTETYQYQENYDTMLLEQIANQNQKDSIIQGNAKDVKQRINSNNQKIQKLEQKNKVLSQELLMHPEAQKILTLIENNRTEILEKYDSLNFWYPLKRFFMEAIFLIPLLIFFFYFYRRAIRNNRELLILVYSHLLVVVSIPILLKILEFVLDVIPFHFLGDLLKLLEALNLVALWNYFLILLAIGVVLGLIYFIQKKVFSRERINLKRIAKGECTVCGVPLDKQATHCFACGAKQLTPCLSCQKLTFQHGKHCQYCGKEISSQI